MLDMNNIPSSVAIIMDGNGRWAEKRRLPRVMGHNAGMKAMREIVSTASQLGVKFLTWALNTLLCMLFQLKTGTDQMKR